MYVKLVLFIHLAFCKKIRVVIFNGLQNKLCTEILFINLKAVHNFIKTFFGINKTGFA